MTVNGHYGTKRHLKYFASRLSFLSQLLGFETSVLMAVESKAEFTPCQSFLSSASDFPLKLTRRFPNQQGQSISLYTLTMPSVSQTRSCLCRLMIPCV